MTYSSHLRPKTVTQSQPIPGKESSMTKNSDGAYVYKMDKWSTLNRFLIIGNEGGTYYSSEKTLTVKNAKNLMDCINADGYRVINTIVEASNSGRAVKNDPAIFALCMATTSTDEEIRKAAYAALPKVCRIGTHLFTFMQNCKDLRKSSRGLRNAIAKYYDMKDEDGLALDLLKYKSRNGWSHKDVFRLIRHKGKDRASQELIKYVFKGESDTLAPLVIAEGLLKKATDGMEIAAIIEEFNVPREMIPTEYLKNSHVWSALLKKMPYTALLRNLNKMTSIGLFDNYAPELNMSVEKLIDEKAISKSRVHPITILTALMTYSKGQGFRGDMTWKPHHRIVAALEDAFNLSLKFGEPLNKNILLAFDVSPSMCSSSTNSILSAAESSAAMGSWLIKSEKNIEAVTFASNGYGLAKGLNQYRANKNSSLKEFMEAGQARDWGGTDCSLPVRYALEKNMPVDLFIIFTDNETNAAHSGHVSEYLKEFRRKHVKDAKMVVCGMTATECSIADPNDPFCLDVAGFDANLPKIIEEFVRGF